MIKIAIGFLSIVLLFACGKPLNSFCLPATVIDRDYRRAYTYITTHTSKSNNVFHTRIITHYVPEKNYVTVKSPKSKELINDGYWYNNTHVGSQVSACYTNYETNHIFNDGKDTTAKFQHIESAALQKVERF